MVASSTLQEQVTFLLKQDLFASAERVGAFLLGASRNEDNHSAALELYADALFGKQELQRALQYYKQAMQRRKVGGAGRASPDDGGPGYSSVTNIEEAELKFKECRCYVALDEIPNAIRALEGVPAALRSLKANLLLGQVYMSTGTGSRLHAMRCFKDAVAQCPTALEAVEALVELGVGGSEIVSLLQRSNTAAADLGWVEEYVMGLCGVQRNDAAVTISNFSALDSRFPNNQPALLQVGISHLAAERLDDAHYYFTKARVVDPLSVDAMDHFALLVKLRSGQPAGTSPSSPQSKTAGELNRLAHDLLAVAPARPEPWLAAALYQQARGDLGAALGHVEKALALSKGRHMLAHSIKGDVLMALGRPEVAIVAYFKAKDARRDLRAYRGLVEAYLAVRKLREALLTAKEATATLRNCAGALVLLGRVLAVPQTGAAEKERARQLFGKALAMDPACADATIALVDLHLGARQHQK